MIHLYFIPILLILKYLKKWQVQQKLDTQKM